MASEQQEKASALEHGASNDDQGLWVRIGIAFSVLAFALMPGWSPLFHKVVFISVVGMVWVAILIHAIVAGHRRRRSLRRDDGPSTPKSSN